MPNLKPPVVTTEQALAYQHRIHSAVSKDQGFQALMTLYLTDNTDPQELIKAKENGVVACKLYPAGATTNSDSGVTDISKMDEVFSAMAEAGLLLLLHGEVTDPDVDIFDRERVFVERILQKLIKRHPTLKIVLEHITTAAAAQFVETGPDRLAATITPHHLLVNRNAMLVGGIKPHYYCLPILKRERDRQELLRVATSGNRKFFLGTDSAPHAIGAKENACGCAGCFTAHTALELYATAFDSVGKIERLSDFSARFGADFYGLPYNEGEVCLEKQAWTVPEYITFGNDVVRGYGAGEELGWKLM